MDFGLVYFIVFFDYKIWLLKGERLLVKRLVNIG